MTLKEARQSWSKRRRRYVVGYLSSGNMIYTDPHREIAFPMTKKEAVAQLRSMVDSGAAIFELKPIVLGGGEGA